MRGLSLMQLLGVFVLFAVQSVPWLLGALAYGDIADIGTPHVGWLWLGVAWVVLASPPARAATPLRGRRREGSPDSSVGCVGFCSLSDDPPGRLLVVGSRFFCGDTGSEFDRRGDSGGIGGGDVIVDCAHYRDGRRQHEGPLDVSRAAEICLEDEGFVWLGLFEPDEAELGEVQDRFGLHELAVEDAQSFHLRPKIERYEESGIFFAVLRTARYVKDREEVEFGEVSVFLSRRFVITVRQGVASDLHGARLRLEDRPGLLKEGTVAVLWAILDTVVDGYAPVIEGFQRDVEEVEATVFSGAAAPTERIYLLRREATDFYRAVHPLLGPLEALQRGAYLEVSSELSQFFRDVNDHLKLVNEEVAAARRAGDRSAGEHGGDLQPADRDQRPPERNDEGVDARRHDLPAPVVHHRLLRDELRLAHRTHHLFLGLRRVRGRQPRDLGRGHLPMVPARRPHRLDVVGQRRNAANAPALPSPHPTQRIEPKSRSRDRAEHCRGPLRRTEKGRSSRRRRRYGIDTRAGEEIDELIDRYWPRRSCSARCRGSRISRSAPS
jgi:magnesium transporter